MVTTTAAAAMLITTLFTVRLPHCAPCARSEYPSSAEQNTDRAVVDQRDVHVGLKAAGLDRQSTNSETGHEVLIARARGIWCGRRVECRSSALADIAEQRELRDDEYAAAGVDDRTIHASLLVGKHAHLANL